MEQYKTCSRCKQERTKECFSLFARSPDGLRPWCKPCFKEYNKTYRLANAEVLRVKKRAYRVKNQHYFKERDAAYYQANKDRLRQKNKLWIQKNPKRYAEMSAVYGSNRRARIRNAEKFRLSANDVRRLLQRPCAYCQGKATEIDHVIPLSRGGTHGIGNLAPACRPCNASKGGRLVMEWRISLSGYEQTNEAPARAGQSLLSLRSERHAGATSPP